MTKYIDRHDAEAIKLKIAREVRARRMLPKRPLRPPSWRPRRPKAAPSSNSPYAPFWTNLMNWSARLSETLTRLPLSNTTAVRSLRLSDSGQVQTSLYELFKRPVRRRLGGATSPA